MRRCFLLFLALLSAGPIFSAETNIVAQPQQAAPAVRARFTLNDGDRVVFLGDTFMEREQLDSYIETMLTLRFPDKQVIFRNLGWSADTPLGESRAGFDAVEKGLDRLKEHLTAVKPTVVFFSHAMSSSFNGVAGLDRFHDDLRKLVATITEICGPSVRLVFVGPVPHEKLPAPLPDPTEHNEILRQYSDVTRDMAFEKMAVFVDLFRGMAQIGPGKTPLTDNGIHLTSYG